ncbi:MAG: M4 family metallopeptidase [Bryobacteraceae bacterium]
MSSRFCILLVSLPALVPAQQGPATPSDLARLRGDEPRRLAFADGQLNAARFRLGLTADHALFRQDAFLDRTGALHVRYRQSYRGVRVLGAGVTAHLDAEDRFLEPTAKLFTGIAIDVTPQVDEAGARAAVLARESSTPPRLEAELAIKPERALVFTDDPSRRVLPNVPGFDEYSWTTTRYRLVWYVRSTTHLDASDSREPEAWIVDAATGAIVSRPSLRAADRAPAPGRARTLSEGELDLDAARDTESGRFELIDPLRGNSRVVNLNKGTGFHPAAAAPFYSAVNVWGDGVRYADANDTDSANGQTPAAGVAVTIARAWDMLGNVFGHAGLDGRGSAVEARVHFGAGRNDAFWHRSVGAAFFGDGAADESSPTDLETVAHELGHGFWFAHVDADGGVDSEADAIGQGNADIFASLVEFYHRGAGGRGSTVGDAVAPWNFRPRMVNPADFASGPANSVPQPGLSYWTVNAPGLDEHAAGTLYGHLFVILARGASADPASPLNSRFFPNGLAGIGVERAAELWYLATTAYLPPEPTFAELRAAWIRAAETLYGAGENPVLAGVRNAFAATGMGLPAVDLIPPSLTSLTIEELNEGEASMLVTASATDDTGVLSLEFLIDNRPALRLARPPYRGWLDIAGLAPGVHTLTARALDNGNKVGFTTTPFAIAGVNQLIAGGGFEGDVSKWTAAAGVIGANEPFLGARNATFTGTQTLSQTVAIGDGSTAAALSFRLRVDNPGGSLTGARLSLEIRDAQGALLETLGSWFDNTGTRDALANHYARRTFDLGQYRGKTIELRFSSNGPEGVTYFRVDNVSLVSAGPASVAAGVTVDEGEGSIIFAIDRLSGVRPDQISRVDYVVEDEVSATSSSAPFRAARELQGFGPRAYSVKAIVYDLAGAKMLESPGTEFSVQQVSQLIRNGGFEAALQNWLRTGATSVVVDTPVLHRAFLGSRAASLAGRGIPGNSDLAQFVEIPAGAKQATLSFRLRIDTQETGGADSLLVRVSEENGQRPRDVLRVRSDFSTRTEDAVNGYVKRTYDISEYAGAIVNLFFQGREDGVAPTAFLIDSVSITWK